MSSIDPFAPAINPIPFACAVTDDEQMQKEVAADFTASMHRFEQAIEAGITAILDARLVLEKNHRHTMVRTITSRLKSVESIVYKMKRFHFDMSVASMEENLTDIAGIRVICSYIYDIYALRTWLARQSGMDLILEKDYISHPKPSGYRSLHLIFMVHLQDGDSACTLPVEFQIRTAAMDSWAALEHQLRYKKNRHTTEDMNRELAECSKLLYETDLRMQKIYLTLHQMDEEQAKEAKRKNSLDSKNNRQEKNERETEKENS